VRLYYAYPLASKYNPADLCQKLFFLGGGLRQFVTDNVAAFSCFYFNIYCYAAPTLRGVPSF